MNKNIITIIGLLLVVTAVAQDAQAYYLQGENALHRGNYTSAASSFRKVTEIDPNDAEAYFYVGEAQRRSGNYAQAIKAYQTAIRLYPEFARAYNNMGDAYKDQGLYAEAVKTYQKAIRIKPDFVEAYCNMGSAYEDNGDFASAISAFEQALQIDPNYGYAKYGLFALRERTKASAPASTPPPPPTTRRPDVYPNLEQGDQSLNPAEQAALESRRQAPRQQNGVNQPPSRTPNAQQPGTRSDGRLQPRNPSNGPQTQQRPPSGTAQRRPESTAQNIQSEKTSVDASKSSTDSKGSEVIKDEASKSEAAVSTDVLNLEGRSVKDGSDIIRPKNITVSGTIVVNITVDALGNVVGASIDRKLSTIKDKKMRTEAVTSARSTKFNSAPGRSRQKGTITYNFPASAANK
jgi:thioredoxin-like negative regulator of GroEL